MKKALLLFLSLAFVFQQTKAQNINLSNSAYFNGECYLTVNPQNPKHIVAAWMHFTISNFKNAMSTRTSFDGGKTWSPLQSLPHVYNVFTCADPTMYFGKDSCVYLAYIDLSGVPATNSGYIMVARSTNGGITWRAPVKAIGWNAQPNLPIDRPWIAADGSNGPYAGRVYLTSQNAYFAPQPHHPWFTFSTDSGSTWSPIARIDDSIPSGNVTDATAFTTVSANGTLYAAYTSYYPAYDLLPRLVVLKSSNGGASFYPYIGINYSVSDEIPAGDSLVKEGMCFSSNPIDSTNLIITAVTNHFGEPDVVSYNSHDAGKTWSGPVRINDDQSGAYDTCHDLAWGGFAPNGTYAEAWRDRRHTGRGDSASFQIYGSTSANGGNSYTPNFLISDTISPPVLIPHGDDFLGCGASDSNIYALWSDMRTGVENTFFNSTSFSKALSVTSISNNSAIKVDAYPNPFHDETTVVIHSAQLLQHCRLLVFSIDGKQVGDLPISDNNPATTIKFNNPLEPGTYIWSLVQDGNKLAEGKWEVQ
jgi:BNR/Asp-box repeat